jgi:hypothetical protein
MDMDGHRWMVEESLTLFADSLPASRVLEQYAVLNDLDADPRSPNQTMPFSGYGKIHFGETERDEGAV